MVYPGEWAVAREDVEDDERLMGEIERTFGADVKDQVSFKMRKFAADILCGRFRAGQF